MQDRQIDNRQTQIGPIEWHPTGPQETDDYVADWAKLMLRVEAMDTNSWWWAVYDHKGTGETIASSNGEGAGGNMAGSLAEAKALCEAAARKYRGGS